MKFSPGDRVLYMNWASPHQGVCGTVMSVDWVGTEWGEEAWVSLRVILDTAHEVQDDAAEWVFERDFANQDWIPF